MPIKKNSATLKLFKGDYKPINMYLGNNKVAGYTKQTFNGNSLSIEGTYKCPLEKLDIYGASSQAITTQNANLFNPDWLKCVYGTTYELVQKDGRSCIKPLVLGNWLYKEIPITWKSNTPYSISFEVYYEHPTTAGLFMGFEFTDGTFAFHSVTPLVNQWITYIVHGRSNKTVKRAYYSYGTSAITYINLNSIIIKEGYTPIEYTPYVGDSPSPSCPSTINSLSNFDLVSCGNNMVKNGDFADGTANWGAAGILGNFSVLDGEASFTSSGTFSGIKNFIPISYGRKYYIRAKIKASSNLVRLVLCRKAGYDTILKSYSSSGQYEVVSNVGIMNSTDIVNPFVTVMDYRSSGWNEVKTKEIMVVDMGADSSNPLYNLTASQMDVLFATFQPYQGVTANILTPLRAIEVPIAFTTYTYIMDGKKYFADYIEKTNNVVKLYKSIGEYELLSSHLETNSADTNTAVRDISTFFYISNRLTNINQTINLAYYSPCSHFKYNDIGANVGLIGGYCVYWWNNIVRFRISNVTCGILATDTDAQRLVKVKAWVDAQKAIGKPIMIIYPQTTTVTDITNTADGIEINSLNTVQYLTNISKTGIESNISADVLVMD